MCTQDCETEQLSAHTGNTNMLKPLRYDKCSFWFGWLQ